MSKPAVSLNKLYVPVHASVSLVYVSIPPIGELSLDPDAVAANISVELSRRWPPCHSCPISIM